MNKQITNVGIISIIVALILGVLGGSYFSDTSSKLSIIEKDANIIVLQKQIDALKGKTSIVYVNQTIEIKVPSAEALLTQAKKDAWKELDDNEKFLTCNNTEYDSDEVTLSRVTEWSYLWIDSDEYKVSYEAKYKFDSSNDDDRCTATRNVSVYYEDGEKPKVTWS